MVQIIPLGRPDPQCKATVGLLLQQVPMDIRKELTVHLKVPLSRVGTLRLKGSIPQKRMGLMPMVHHPANRLLNPITGVLPQATTVRLLPPLQTVTMDLRPMLMVHRLIRMAPPHLLRLGALVIQEVVMPPRVGTPLHLTEGRQ